MGSPYESQEGPKRWHSNLTFEMVVTDDNWPPGQLLTSRPIIDSFDYAYGQLFILINIDRNFVYLCFPGAGTLSLVSTRPINEQV